jgi:acyl-CoA thioester hydrolase
LNPFVWQARVYWEDTDAGGIVYYANYLRFLERARSEWLRARGVSQLALARDPGLVFSVVALEVQYRRPARLDDLLSISCEPDWQGGASILFAQRIWRDPAERDPLVTASVRVACLEAGTLKPRRLPPVIVRELSASARGAAATPRSS